MANSTPSQSPATAIFCNVTTNDTNSSCPPAQQYGRDEFLAKFEQAVLGLILFMALFGNMVVIIVLLLRYRKRKLSRMQLFIIHLAIADISVGLCQVLPQLIMDITYRFDGNNFLCKLVKYLQVGTMYGSTYVLIMTALDRYMSICHPLTSQTWTSRRVHVMVLTAWTLSGLFSIPQLVIFSYKQRYDGVYDCLDNFDISNALWELQVYITWIFVSIYFVPFIILTVCYTRICYVVWVSVNAKESTFKAKKKYKSWSIYKSERVEKESEACLNGSPKNIRNPRAHTKRLSKSKIKTVKMTLTVIICFLVCWAPFFITQMWAAYDLDAPYLTSKYDNYGSCISLQVLSLIWSSSYNSPKHHKIVFYYYFYS